MTAQLTGQLMLVGIVLTTGPALAQTTLHVDDDALPGGDGLTWDTAFDDLQDALLAAEAAAGEITEIRVAAGAYTPDRGTGDRTASFWLVDGVALRGGYAGMGQPDPDERDVALYETILSGDLAGDDDDDPGAEGSPCCEEPFEDCDDSDCVDAVAEQYSPCAESSPPVFVCSELAQVICCSCTARCENSYHVARADETGAETVLDGFTVTGGNANGLFPNKWGGGICSFDVVNSTISNCVIEQNTAVGNGGAVMFAVGEPVLSHCVIRENRVIATGPGTGNGGAISVANVTSMWDNLLFEDNEAPNEGGAVHVHVNGPTLVTCEFRRCLARQGQAIAIVGGLIRLIDCDFEDNGDAALPEPGASTIWNWYADLEAFGCRMANNEGVSGEAALVSFGTDLLVNCLFDGNQLAAIEAGHHATQTLVNCTVVENLGSLRSGGLDSYSDVAPVISNCVFWGNTAPSATTQAAQISADQTPVINYTCVQGWTGEWGGVGNHGDDPDFVAGSGPDGIPGTDDDDWRLSPGSPGIHAGDPAFVPSPEGATDLDGVPRVLYGRVDMGAYEFAGTDFDDNGVIDLLDYAAWADCVTGPDNGPYADGCEIFDGDADGDIDLNDFTGFQVLFEGS